MIPSTALGTLSDLDSSGLFELILETSEIITYTPCISKVYEKFALALKKLVEFDRANITFIDETARTVTIHYHYGHELPDRRPGQTRPIAGTRAQRVLETGQTVIEEDIAAGHWQSAASDAALRSGLRSSIAVPLCSRGKIMGALSLRCRRAGAYGPREQAILEQLARLIAPSVECDRLVMQVKQAAPYDKGGTSAPQRDPPDITDKGNHKLHQTLFPDAVLSPREQCVLKHVARGSNNNEIAAALEVSANTVKTHVRHILRKLQVSNRVQAALVINGQSEAER